MITIYWQKNPLWGELEIIKGMPMKFDGCFICSEASLAGKTPDVVLNILKVKKAILPDGRLAHPNDALALGFKSYEKKPPDYKPTFPVIAETNYYAPNYIQHFFVYFPDGTIGDPLTGLTGVNKYKEWMVSFRVYA
jgi:hypothetical protein